MGASTAGLGRVPVQIWFCNFKYMMINYFLTVSRLRERPVEVFRTGRRGLIGTLSNSWQGRAGRRLQPGQDAIGRDRFTVTLQEPLTPKKNRPRPTGFCENAKDGFAVAVRT